MKKAMKAVLCILSAITMAAGSAVSVSAGTLSKEELIEKYMPDGAYDIVQRNYDEHWHGGTSISYFNDDDMEIDVYAYVQGLMEDLQERSENMTEEEYRKEQEELAQKTVAICQNADHRAYVYNDYRYGWNYQQWFKNCEYENGFWYVLREDGSASIVGAEQEDFKGKEVLEIPSEIGGAVVKEIEPHAFDVARKYLQDINEIVIPDTVEIIGESAFNAALLYSKSGKINLPNNVKYIGRWAFASCVPWMADISYLIHIPESVEYIGCWAFCVSDITKNHAVLAMPESLVLIEGSAVNLHSFQIDNGIWGRSNYIDMDDVAEYYASKSAAKPLPLAALVGDVDGSGKVDVSDSVLLARYCAEDDGITLTADGKLNADANGDGSITLDDVTEILRIVAKL